MCATFRDNNEVGCVLLIVIILALIFSYLGIALRGEL
jgi:hypothetical protein